MTRLHMVVPLDAAGHRATQEILPWYAACSLGREDVLRVEAHLAECPHCQASLRWEQGLLAQYRALEIAGDVQRAFGALRLQVELRHARARVLPLLWQRLLRAWQDAAPWLRRTLVVQFVVVLACGALLALTSRDDYRALGSGAPVNANLVVKFRPDTSAEEIRLTLLEIGAHFAGGPTASDAYMLSVPPGHSRVALLRLRERRSVIFAESLNAAGGAP